MLHLMMLNKHNFHPANILLLLYFYLKDKNKNYIYIILGFTLLEIKI